MGWRRVLKADLCTSSLSMCCAFHFLNDGYVAAIYPLLPLISRELQLSYAEVGIVRAALRVSLALFQLPSVMVGELFGEFPLLVAGMALLSMGLLSSTFSFSLFQLVLSMLLAGIGGSVYHPVGTSIVSKTSKSEKRGSKIGVLNFSGDVGKAVVPLAVSFLASAFGWRSSFGLLGLFGIAISLLLHGVLRRRFGGSVWEWKTQVSHPVLPIGYEILGYPRRFYLLCFVGILDQVMRTGVLTFIPFLLLVKGVPENSIGLCVSLLFIGGALGKFGCGPISDSFGSTATIALTEILTGLAIFAVLSVYGLAVFPFLVILGFFLNGTSTVLYSVVPELVSTKRTGHAYGMFYTLTLASGASAPVLLGFAADVLTLETALMSMSFFGVFVGLIAPVILRD